MARNGNSIPMQRLYDGQRAQKMLRAISFSTSNERKMQSADRAWETIINNRSFPTLGQDIVKSTGKYVKISLKDQNSNINDAHPYQLGQIMKQYFTDHDEQVRMRNAIMLKTKDEKQFNTVMNLKQPVNVTVKGVAKDVIFEEVVSKNITKGIVFENSWMQLTTDEIKDELNKENHKVREVRQMTRRNKDKTEEKTNRYIITFDSEELPERVKLYGMSYRIRQYYPSPLVCVKCLKVGHIQTKCNQQHITCRHCGGVVSEEHVCQSPPICPNCPAEDNHHIPNCKECPRMESERLITNCKINNRVSYGKAREIVENLIKNDQSTPQNQWNTRSESIDEPTTNKKNDDQTCLEIIRVRNELKTVNERIAELNRLHEELKKAKIREQQLKLTLEKERNQPPKDTIEELNSEDDDDYEMKDAATKSASNKRSSEEIVMQEKNKIAKREIAIQANSRKKAPQGMSKVTPQEMEHLCGQMDAKQLEKYNEIMKKAGENKVIDWYDDGKTLIHVKVPSSQ